jgi:aryl-alcohol dehydrogenase-like predicted oxidoreductase
MGLNYQYIKIFMFGARYLMDLRDYGTTGLKVSVIGYGAGAIGDHRISEKKAETLLNGVLDSGITLIDTARGYGTSEERIGRYLSHCRDQFVLSTKVGYGIEGYADWTYECVMAGVDYALKSFKTDYIDIVHLHSCSLEILQQGEVIDALDEVIRQGKIRVGSYSGENEELNFAVHTNRFRSIMASVNICDQRIINRYLPIVKDKGLGMIAKRPIANVPWRFDERPYGDYSEEYWQRWKTMNLNFGMDWLEVALRFSAFTDGVDSCIIGTTDLQHVQQNVNLINKGKLPEIIIAALKSAFIHHDKDWIGQL